MNNKPVSKTPAAWEMPRDDHRDALVKEAYVIVRDRESQKCYPPYDMLRAILSVNQELARRMEKANWALGVDNG